MRAAGTGPRGFSTFLTPASLEVVTDAQLESALAQKGEGFGTELERVGYFSKDRDSTLERPVWNRTIGQKIPGRR